MVETAMAPPEAAAAAVEALFVSSGCNKTVRAAAWGPCDLVAFATHFSVGIFSPQESKILATLPGHKNTVNCVEWLPQDQEASEFYLLSGSADGVVILWSFNPSQNKWKASSQTSASNGSSVTCITSIMLSSTEALFASSASDGKVYISSASLLPEKENCTISLVDTIETVGSRPVVAVTIARLPGQSNNILLAIGTLDNVINIYSGNKIDKFTHACKLKGHQDWVRGLDFSGIVLDQDGVESLFLASSSQDRNIRIWKIHPRLPRSSTTPSLNTYIEGPVFRSGKESWQISLESLLVGHEDWVCSVRWEPVSDKKLQPMSVLSSSMDKTMMVWRPEVRSGIWMNEVTVGELGQTALGFFGGVWSPRGDGILAHGFNGSFHLWKEVSSRWIPQIVPSGHFSPVVDVAWASNRQFLISASHDQTTRVFTRWNRDDRSSSWHEIARPQLHGHDMNCLAVLGGGGNHRYVSGADEKVARVFEAPTAFLDTIDAITGSRCNDDARQGVQILGANMSALGLSQKPIYSQAGSNENSRGDEFSGEYVPNAVPTVLAKPPLEEQLVQNTLWPESHKLYGHGNELYSMCSNRTGDILATACKAQTAKVAEIWLWETKSWRPIAQLESHTLTVTQMEFSPDDRFLLSVSRDRHLSLFRISRDSQPPSCSLLAKLEAHKRIVWTCSWSPCGTKFATGSRDKSVKIWSLIDDAKVELSSSTRLPAFGSSVTALAWGKKLLAVGMESGMIELWSIPSPSSPSKQDQARCVVRFDAQMCHGASVNRLCWNGDDEQQLMLASCGADHAVRLFSILCD